MASRAPAQAARAPARAAEPGSTNRAQTARKAAKTDVPRGGAAISARGASSGVVNVSSSLFEPSQAVAEEIEKAGPRGLDVRVIAKGLTGEGLIKVRQDRGKFDSIGPGTMPLLNPWTQKLGGMHLNFEIDNSAIKNGYASFKPRGGDRNDWLQSLKKDSALLGGLGLNVESLPKPVNKFEQGKLMLGVSGMKVLVGGYVDASFDLLLENMEAPKVSGSAEIDIRGAAKGKLTFDNPGNVLRGSVSLAVNFKSFSGAVMVAYRSDGTVDISGSAAYNANKLSGEIQFVATDLDTANKFAKDALAAAGGKDNVQNAGPPSPVPVPKEGKKKRALAATGRLSFNLTTWFAGTVNVVVDGKGEITVIGKIAPPGEIILFPERAWNKEIVKFEAKAYYGIPVVGNLNLFANISLAAIAKLGPARLYAIEILGTYSTDPEIQKNIQISGSINISAYGGLQLRAEGGAALELVAHEIKFGIGLKADVGVKAYADARPTIGYRDPGHFYVSGTLDLVAQPMLGLGGEFFIALDAPWFSPLSDKRWSWPLFSKEWPLGDPIGMSATLKDYVLGSGKVPEIELKPPEFDPSKFMTTMVDDKLPSKSGGTGAGRGTFKEDGTVPKPVVKPKLPPPKSVAAKPSKKGAKPALGKSARPDSKAANDAKSTAILQKAAKPLTDLKGRGPLTRGSLDQGLGKIRSQASGIGFGVRPSGAKWLVSPKAGTMTGKALEIGAKPETGASGSEKTRGKGSRRAIPDKIVRAEREQHRLFVAPVNGRPALKIQSVEMTAGEFLRRAQANAAIPAKRKTRIPDGLALVATIDLHVYQYESAVMPVAQERHLAVITRSEEALSKILQQILRKVPIAAFDQRYTLEGMVGTYGSLKNLQSGDLMTPDHQPQAAVLKYAAKLPIFAPPAGAALRAAAGGQHADGATAINLHEYRHMLGRTFGTPGSTTAEAAIARINAAVSANAGDPDRQRGAVVRIFHAELVADATVMRAVYARPLSNAAWADLRQLVTAGSLTQTDAETLRERIVHQVDRGESRMLNQALDRYRR